MNILLFFLLSAALISIQCLIGGTRLLFAFPAYIGIGAAALLSVLALRKPLPRPSTLALASTLLLGGYVLIRAFHSPVPYLSWPDLYMAGGCLLVYLLTALYLTEPRARLWLVGTILVLAAGQTWVAWVQHYKEPTFMLFGFIGHPGGGIHATRATGQFISGNHLAGFLETAAVLALGAAFWSRWRWPLRLLAGAVALGCYFGVALSGSRGGYLSSAFSLLAFVALSAGTLFLVRGRRAWLPVGAVLAAVVALAAAALFFGSRNELVLKRAQMIGTSGRDIRVYNWQAALDQFRLAPVFGTGAGTHLLYGRLFRRPPLQTDPVHAHGDYLEMLAEYGATGLGLALIFAAIHLGNGVREGVRLARFRAETGATPRSSSLALNLGALAGVAGLLSHSVVDFNMHIPANALLYAFLFGVLANPSGQRPQPPSWASLTMGLRLLAPLGGLALILASAVKIEGERRAEAARVALRNQEYSRAVTLAQRAVSAEPENPYPWFYLGEGHRMIGMRLPLPALSQDHFEKAVRSYQRGLERLPNDHSLLIRLGQTLDALHRPGEAEQAYLRALEWDPNLGVLYVYYAAHLKLRGMDKEAAAVYRKALSLQARRDTGLAELQTLRDRRSEGELESRPADGETQAPAAAAP